MTVAETKDCDYQAVKQFVTMALALVLILLSYHVYLDTVVLIGLIANTFLLKLYFFGSALLVFVVWLCG